MNPSVSICIPAYNSGRYLPETLARLVRQTCTDWELIVVEDGSADPVTNLVAAFARTVPQPVRYLAHERNRGLPSARNTGIAAARGEWIALLDADDLWASEHLSTLLAAARHRPDADFVHAGSLLFDSESGRQLETRAPSAAAIRDFPRSLYLGDYLVQPSSVLMKKSLWAQVGGFNPDFTYVEDREMWLRCARAGGVFLCTGLNTCLYRKHAAAMTTHAGPMALACARVMEQHLDWEVVPSPLRRRLTAAAWVAAGRISLRSAARQARGCFARAWQVRPAPRIAAYWLAAWLLGLRRLA